jgi:phosphate transport system permease protein
MTDASLTGRIGLHTDSGARAKLAARYRAEALFKGLGLGALLLAGAFLVVFLTTIVREGYPAFFQNYLSLEIDLKREDIDPQNTRDPKVIGAADYDAMVRTALLAQYPGVTDRLERRAIANVISSGASVLVRREVLANPEWIGSKRALSVPVDDLIDLYIKGSITTAERTAGVDVLGVSGQRGSVELTAGADTFTGIVIAIKTQIQGRLQKMRADVAGRQRVVAQLEEGLPALLATLTGAAEGDGKREAERRLSEQRKTLETARADIAALTQRIEGLEKRLLASGDREVLDRDLSSYFVRVHGGVIKLTSVVAGGAQGQVLLPLQSAGAAPPGSWELVRLAAPEASRRLPDREIIYAERLIERGMVKQGFSKEFFLGGASREPELAGVGVAIIGSLITLVITLGLSFPIGVAAAIYLEEFAPKNWLTEIIEVNINNLAAVPSIIFGLLGLAVFLNVFDLPRSAPLVGGLVLALMTLPIIIIASRAAIRAVPPSIKEAALGVGASHQQAVFHHVLPLAMPGILTGTILGMAHALGETAPLLMIGMVAFVVDYPKSFSDAATLLPVQIFMWADFPEMAFQQKTAAAIMVLLVFLVAMNLVAILLRKKFERRW